MKKIIFFGLALLSFNLSAQNFTPSLNKNLELIFVDYLMPYNSIINIDPTTNPSDTFSVLEAFRNGNGAYLQGREFEYDTLVSTWSCSINGNQNFVYIIDPATADTMEYEIIYRDAQGRDTLYQTFYDTSAFGQGALSLAQEFRIYYGANGIDSAFISDVGSGGFGNDIRYIVYRNAQNQVDSLVADVEFMGVSFPVQTLIYYASNGQLDSINLKNTLTGEIEEQVRTQNNAAGLVEKFFIYELGQSNNWELYIEYHLSLNSFFSIAEQASAKLNFYPNPSEGRLNLNNQVPADIKVLNLNGEIVWQENELSPNSEVNLSFLAKGLYLVQLKLNDGRVYSEKILMK